MTEVTRVWDRDFKLVHSGEGDPGKVLGELFVTVDRGGRRSGGRIMALTLSSPAMLDGIQNLRVDQYRGPDGDHSTVAGRVLAIIRAAVTSAAARVLGGLR